ncbi:cytochrome c biogenesis protein CcsA [Rubrivivax sp. A210]|uniref:cytochrome c biogenesis protein CcsA n=1 Tax=Rubrivivax sp. A210 TaxID=2772301 RepID=UPI001F3CEEFF|nr:cytochrome c biogenesis protein CcsA [Rubrivivax sp. A210]
MSSRLSVDPPAPGLVSRWLEPAAAPGAHGLAERVEPWCWPVAGLLGALGLVLGLLVAPADALQGDVFRIMFIHVPAAWMSLALFAALALAAASGLAFRLRLADKVAAAVAPTGTLMCCIALWTGALWAKPVWGSWWVWDARLSAELLMLLLFVGYLVLRGAIVDSRRADRAAALWVLLGAGGLPILYLSLQWWASVHPDQAPGTARGPEMASLMVAAMLLMVAAFAAWCLGSCLHRLHSIVLERGTGLDGA